jgi:hypothetical protein
MHRMQKMEPKDVNPENSQTEIGGRRRTAPLSHRYAVSCVQNLD